MEQEFIKQSQKLVSEDPLLGINLGKHYHSLELLGRGGMGAVYKARDLLLDKECAIKVIHHADLTSDETALKRFRQEAKAASLLSHDGIANIRGFDIDQETGTPFLVMDLVSGSTLSELIRQGSINPALLLSIAIQVTEALEHAHAHGVIHRDIKPSNIVVNETASDHPKVKLLDFGIAKIVDKDAKTLTKTGEILGTPTYMSPEQCSGQPLDARSDIYSLGCVLYEGLNGKPPFQGETPLEVVFKHISDEPTAATTIKGLLPLNAVIQKCLEKKPSARYANATQLRKDLENIVVGKGNQTYVSQGQRKKNVLRLITVCCVTLAILILGLKHFVEEKDVEYWNHVIASEPNNGLAYYKRGEVHLKGRLYRAALRDFTKASQLLKNSSDAHRKRSICYSTLGEYKDAEVAASEAIKIDPTNDKAYIDRGQAWQKLDDYQHAISDYTEAIRLNPGNTHSNKMLALYNRAGSYVELGEYRKALDDCEAALKLANADQKYWVPMHRASANLGLKNYQSVIDDCTEIIKHDPNERLAYSLRAQARRELGDLDGALADLDAQILLAEPRDRLYIERATIETAREKFAEARKDCDAALEARPDNYHAYLLRAHALIKLKDYEAAKRDLQTYSKHHKPTDPAIVSFLQHVERLLKNH